MQSQASRQPTHPHIRPLRRRIFPIMVFTTLVSIMFRFARELSTPYMAVVALGLPAQICAALWADSASYYSLVYIMSAVVGWDVLSVFSSRLARLVMDPSVTRPLLTALAVMLLVVLGLGSPDLVLAGVRRAGAAAYQILRQAGDGGGTFMMRRRPAP